MEAERLTKLLEAAIPRERLDTNPGALDGASRDQTECPAGRPDIIAHVESAEELAVA
jgi:hypothetical protein